MCSSRAYGKLSYLPSFRAVFANKIERYIAKILRIYIICAIVVYKDAENLCAENGFQQVKIDQMERSCV